MGEKNIKPGKQNEKKNENENENEQKKWLLMMRWYRLF